MTLPQLTLAIVAFNLVLSAMQAALLVFYVRQVRDYARQNGAPEATFWQAWRLTWPINRSGVQMQIFALLLNAIIVMSVLS